MAPLPLCHIVGAGSFYEQQLRRAPGDLCIAADGGLMHLQALDQWPDLLIGDLDSVLPDVLADAQRQGIPIQRLPREKDETDTFAAILHGLSCGYKRFALYGVTGGRLSHTLANLHCLDYLSLHGARGVIHDHSEWIMLIRSEQRHFAASAQGHVSIFAYGGNALGVTLSGLKYPLEDATLTCDFPLGVSNEFQGCESTIGVRDGALLVLGQRGQANIAQEAPPCIPS